MQRLPLAKYLAINVFIWGGVLACTAACKNWAGLMLVRTFLGIFESTVTPGFVLITSQWYTRAEQPLRIGVQNQFPMTKANESPGLWYSFNGFAQIFGVSQILQCAVYVAKISNPYVGCVRFRCCKTRRFGSQCCSQRLADRFPVHGMFHNVACCCDLSRSTR